MSANNYSKFAWNNLWQKKRILINDMIHESMNEKIIAKKILWTSDAKYKTKTRGKIPFPSKFVSWRRSLFHCVKWALLRKKWSTFSFVHWSVDSDCWWMYSLNDFRFDPMSTSLHKVIFNQKQCANYRTHAHTFIRHLCCTAMSSSAIIQLQIGLLLSYCFAWYHTFVFLFKLTILLR